jgi:hypothetical protein
VRDPLDPAIAEKREAAIEEAMKLLRPLAEHAGSWAVISWNDPDASDPRDVYEAAIAYVTALLDPAPPPPPEAKDYMDRIKTYDSRAQYLADELLGAQAVIVRKVVLPALRELGRLPTGESPHRRGGKLLRDRWIAAVVTTVCQRFELDPYRNPASAHECNGCAIVAEVLKRLEIGLEEKTVATIYGQHRQA